VQQAVEAVLREVLSRPELVQALTAQAGPPVAAVAQPAGPVASGPAGCRAAAGPG
jgi:hypothetical protein